MNELQITARQLRDGDVLVFRADGYLSVEAEVRIMAALNRWVETLPVKVYPLLLDQGLSLETLSAEGMRDLGWVRVEQFAEAH